MVSQIISASTNDSSCLVSAAHFASSSQFKSPQCFTCICVVMQWLGVGNGTFCSCWVPVTLISLFHLLVQFHRGACELQGGASSGMWLNPWGQPSFGVPTGWGYCEMLVGLPSAGVWGIHLRVIQTQASNNTVGSLHSWTHSDSCRVFLPKRLYFSGWHLLCLTLNSSNFHGIHIHCGFSVEFLILTFYCLCTSFEILFFSFVWCQLQWLRKVLVLLHHM